MVGVRPVCHDGWDDNDAKVVCRQLGLKFTKAVATHSSFFGNVAPNFFLNDVACQGHEQTLSDCRYTYRGKLIIPKD